MSEKIVTLNEEVIKGQLKELVRGYCFYAFNGYPIYFLCEDFTLLCFTMA